MTTTAPERQSMTMEELVPYDKLEKDHNLKVHIATPAENLHIWRPGMSTPDMITVARCLRVEIVAICGHRWIPSHNPEEIKDVCEACTEEAAKRMQEAGE